MPTYNKAQIERVAKQNGFIRDTFEKVLRLIEILKFINEHHYLREHLILKGGTAINMTIFNLPRLSVDIDLDYIPNCTRDEMLKSRGTISEIINHYIQDEGYQLSPISRFSFSLDSFILQYINAGGNRDSIKIEINYSLRAHIFQPVKRKIQTDVFDDELEILTLNAMEIFSSKINALLSRAAARDLYDFNNMVYYGLFDKEDLDMFRKCIIFYNTISQETVNKAFNTSAIDGLNFGKIKRDLLPVLRKKENIDLETQKKKAKAYINAIMVLTKSELEYMTEFENKSYRPELLFDDAEIVERISEHPMAIWKCR